MSSLEIGELKPPGLSFHHHRTRTDRPHLSHIGVRPRQRTMSLSKVENALKPAIRRGLLQSNTNTIRLRNVTPSLAVGLQRTFHNTSRSLLPAPGSGLLGSHPPSYFQRPSLPANTVVRFVPQQTAWIVERMGKFSRILEPGLAILVPFIDRIAYVKSLKEVAIEIPSQSAITADNVTLELDGVLYTRVFDAYKARCVNLSPPRPLFLNGQCRTILRTAKTMP